MKKIFDSKGLHKLCEREFYVDTSFRAPVILPLRRNHFNCNKCINKISYATN